MTIEQFLILGLLGLVSGAVGGMAGIGGSVIMLPGMALIIGYKSDAQDEHHLFMASAMMVNVLVAIPSALRHHKAGFVRADIVRTLLPTTTLAIVAGVLLSNAIDGSRLRLALAAFIAVYCVSNLLRIILVDGRDSDQPMRIDRSRLAISGGLTGSLAGLLGVGGGGVLVPLLQIMCRVPLRIAVASSLAIMPFTATVGAVVKAASLPARGQSIGDALMLVLALGPCAVVGGFLGAAASHHLPLKTVRICITIALTIVAAKLAGLF